MRVELGEEAEERFARAKSHMASVFRKLHVSNRVELAALVTDRR